jgi:hypothetical protein
MVIDRHGRSSRLWVHVRRGLMLGLMLGLPMVAVRAEEVDEEIVGHSVPWCWRLVYQGGLAGFLSEASVQQNSGEADDAALRKIQGLM